MKKEPRVLGEGRERIPILLNFAERPREVSNSRVRGNKTYLGMTKGSDGSYSNDYESDD